MNRRDDWPERLAEYLDARRRAPFQWGHFDCCRFCCAGLAVQGLPDPMPAAARRYKTERGALTMIRRLGGTLDEAGTRLAGRAGFKEIPVLMAGRGFPVLADMVLPDGTEAPALGLVSLDARFALFAHADGGLLQVPVTGCRRAWSLD